MKKFFLIILGILSTIIVSINKTQALSLADFTPVLDKKVASMQTTQEKVNFLQSFSDLLTEPLFTKDKDAKFYAELRTYSLSMLNVFQHELMQEQTNSPTATASNKITINPSTLNLPHISSNFSNIDVQKVRDAMLSWHNYERQSLWGNAYSYSLDLEWTATVRANKLATSGKTSNLHARNEWDGYYNYNSMLNRFSGLWIKFPKSINWWASFSESVGYNTYRCSKSDCTEDLITAIKKTRTWLILKEKASNGSHYKAATMKYFTQMWIWIALDRNNNRYYIVLHYGVNF